MTNEKESAAVVANGAAKKVNRRGINNSRHAVNRLKFHEKDAASNGLFVAHLDSVSVDWSVNAEAKAFTGLRVPRLTFTFASNHTNVNERRYIVKTLFPVESNVDTIPDGKDAWQVDNVLNWAKHILDVLYFKGREMTPEEEDALTLTFEDFTEDENGDVWYNPYYIISGNVLITTDSEQGVTLLTMKASSYNGSTINLTFSIGETTAVEKVKLTPSATKYIHNGKVIIRRAGQLFDLLGRKQ